MRPVYTDMVRMELARRALCCRNISQKRSWVTVHGLRTPANKGAALFLCKDLQEFARLRGFRLTFK